MYQVRYSTSMPGLMLKNTKAKLDLWHVRSPRGALLECRKAL